MRVNKTYNIIIAILVAFGLFSMAIQQPAASEYATTGYNAESQMELSQATVWYQAAVQQDPAWDLPWRALARIALQQHHASIANAYIHHAIDHNAHNPANWILASQIAIAGQHEATAIADATRAYDINHSLDSLKNLSALLLQTGFNAPLLAVLQGYQESDSTLLASYGIALLHDDQPEKAAAIFAQLPADNRIRTVYLNLAARWQSMQINALELLNADILMGFYQEAKIPLASLIRYIPIDPATMVSIAWGEWFSGQTATAQELARHIPFLTDEQIGLHALIAMANGQPQSAMTIILQHAASIDQLAPSLQLLLADAARADHQYGIAEEALLALTTTVTGPDRILMLIHLAQFYLATGLGESAGRMQIIIQTLSVVRPQTGEIMDLLGQWHQHIGDLAAAAVDFQFAIELDPGNVLDYQHLASLEAQMGDITATNITTNIIKGLQQ